MLFLLWLTARLLTRLLVIPSGAGDGSGDSWSDAGQWARLDLHTPRLRREWAVPALRAAGQPLGEHVVVGGAFLEVISRGRGRRPPSSYRRQLLARERGRHRRRRRRGSNAHGITIFLDTLPPEAKRRP